MVTVPLTSSIGIISTASVPADRCLSALIKPLVYSAFSLFLFAAPDRSHAEIGSTARRSSSAAKHVLFCSVSEAATLAAQAQTGVFLCMVVFALIPVVLLVVLARGVRNNAASSWMAWMEWHRQM